jgi:glycolate oxidase FAD binding subunit
MAVRLHPLPQGTATARFAAADADELARIAAELAHRPLELDALDVEYPRGAGAILARFAGATAADQAAALGVDRAGAAEVIEDDEPLWNAQRAGQRSAEGTLVRVSALPTELPDVLRAADNAGAGRRRPRGSADLSPCRPGGARGGRAPAGRSSRPQRRRPRRPGELRGAIDPWGVKGAASWHWPPREGRFDPTSICNPGLFLGGI